LTSNILRRTGLRVEGILPVSVARASCPRVSRASRPRSGTPSPEATPPATRPTPCAMQTRHSTPSRCP